MKILVSGLINIETTLAVHQFPVTYEPTRFPFHGVNSSVSGVGYNISKALVTLGNEVAFLSIIGRDIAAQQVFTALKNIPLDERFILQNMEHTAQSVILYDPGGKRAIFCDLKDAQEQIYPAVTFEQAAQGCDLCVLCNINFNRSLLAKVKALGKLIATDVHTLASVEDEYNQDFMQAADILFMSDERLPAPPEAFALQVMDRFSPRILVIGMGAAGAALALRGEGVVESLPAVTVRPIVNTIGAGDSLFSAFLHSYLQKRDPRLALRKAMVFAAHKIGERGAADGFLDAAALDEFYMQHDES
jgi:sugar/nucleoside kinase (ribokinase family)